jgi:tetratricopeptide (TPR) repeat protein
VTFRERRRPLLLALLGIALFAGAVALAHRIQVAGDRPYDVSFVPSASSLRWLSLGHPTLAANLFWLRAVQYMGDARADERGWEKLRPLVEVVTDLDPRHGYAYQTSSNLLACAGRLADSNAILEKGTRSCPDRYILPFQRAVNAFMYAGDYEEAGRWFGIAAQTPGAPSRMREYVVAMYAKADRSEAAISFLRHLEGEAQDDESRKAIDHQIRRATLERDANRLEQAAALYRKRRLLAPVCLEQLVSDGIVPAIPEDPFGGAYYLDEEGRVHSTVFAKRLDRPPTPAERERELREYRSRTRTAVEANR